jgi:modification methylase
VSQAELVREIVEAHQLLGRLGRNDLAVLSGLFQAEQGRRQTVARIHPPAELVYDDATVRIFRGDARLLPLPDECAHLVVTSPPYNCRAAYDSYTDWLPWEEYWHGLIEPVLRECYRILVHGGRIAINMPNVVRQDVGPGARDDVVYFSNSGRKWKPAGANGEAWSVMVAPRLWMLLEQIGFLPREQLTWVKAADPADIATSTAWGSWRSASNPVLRAVGEPVFIASKGTHRRTAGESDLTAAEFKAWTRNVWNISSGHADQYLDHPAMFPLELPRRLIKLYSFVGDLVVDPFAGAGTTLRAAKDLGRLGVGVEQSERYCRLAAARCAQQVLPLDERRAEDNPDPISRCDGRPARTRPPTDAQVNAPIGKAER